MLLNLCYITDPTKPYKFIFLTIFILFPFVLYILYKKVSFIRMLQS